MSQAQVRSKVRITAKPHLITAKNPPLPSRPSYAPILSPCCSSTHPLSTTPLPKPTPHTCVPYTHALTHASPPFIHLHPTLRPVRPRTLCGCLSPCIICGHQCHMITASCTGSYLKLPPGKCHLGLQVRVCHRLRGFVQ